MKILSLRLFESLRMNLPLPLKYFLRNINTFFTVRHLSSLFSFHDSDKLQGFFSMLSPYECGYPLIRYGFNGDGGYLIPAIPVNWDGIVSPGVGGSIEFEKSLASSSTKVILIDGTVECPEDLPSNFYFYSKMLASHSRNTTEITLAQILEKHNLKKKSNLLQMDIEGFEWEILPNVIDSDLLEFQIFIVEFHFSDLLLNAANLFSKEKIIKQLLESYFVCHFHINNAGGFFFFNGKRYPKVLEVTWLRRDIFTKGKPANIPHTLDFPNDPEIFNWSKFGSIF